MPRFFFGPPSRLSPNVNNNEETIPGTESALSPKLLEKRATKEPLPETVSPLCRRAVINASPRKSKKFLKENYQQREHRYGHDGQLRPEYAKLLVLAKSPKAKITASEGAEVRKLDLKTVDSSASRESAMSEASRMAEKYEKFEDLERYNAKWAAKFKRLWEAKRAEEEFEALQCRNAEWAGKASRLREARRAWKKTDAISGARESSMASSPDKKPFSTSGCGSDALQFGSMTPVTPRQPTSAPNKANANFSNRSEHKRSKPDASTSTSPSSAVRQRVPSGTRIPPKTSTYMQNIVPDFAHAPTHVLAHGPNTDAQQAVGSFITAFWGYLKMV